MRLPPPGPVQHHSSKTGLGLPLTRYILQHTSMSVVALTSKTSRRIKDDMLSDVGQSSSSTAPEDRLRVVTGVDLLTEDTVERAAKEAELKKSARLIVCLAGEVGCPLQPKPGPD